MLIAVIIFLFFHSKAFIKRFFSTSLVALYRGNALELDNKSFRFNPSPAKSKHIRKTAYPSFIQRLKEISRMQLITLS